MQVATPCGTACSSSQNLRYNIAKTIYYSHSIDPRTNSMKYSIFCDESGTVKERYMLLGGVILPYKNVVSVEKKIKSIKASESFREDQEMKFTKLNNHRKLQLYKRIIEEVYLNQDYGLTFSPT